MHKDFVQCSSREIKSQIRVYHIEGMKITLLNLDRKPEGANCGFWISLLEHQIKPT